MPGVPGQGAAGAPGRVARAAARARRRLAAARPAESAHPRSTRWPSQRVEGARRGRCRRAAAARGRARAAARARTAASVTSRVGQRERLGLELDVAEQQQVDVDRPRAVARAAEHRARARPRPPCRARAARSGSSSVRIADGGVEEVGLVEDLADRLGLVERGGGLDLHAVLAQGRDRVAAGAAHDRRRSSRGRGSRRARSLTPASSGPRCSSSSSRRRETSTATSSIVTGSGGSGFAARTCTEPAPKRSITPLADHVAEALERLVAALGRGQDDDVADLGVVDRVLEAVGEHGVAARARRTRRRSRAAGRPPARPR